MVTAYFHLSENQFKNLDFRKTYLIDKQYYLIYNIEHNLTSNDPVKIQFLKLKTAPSFIAVAGSGNGGGGGVLDNEDLPIFATDDNSQYFNNVDKSKVSVMGTTETQPLLEFTTQVQFLETGVSEAFLPDATLQQPDTGDVVIEIKNINGGAIKLYPLIDTQTINGSADYDLQDNHGIRLVAYKGNWQIISASNAT